MSTSVPNDGTHDLTDPQWELIAPLLPPTGVGGRPRTLDLRAVVDAIRHLFRSGCTWRDLPRRYPNPSSVRTYYDRWRRDGTWARICTALAEDDAGL